jgi:hypothetical protein
MTEQNRPQDVKIDDVQIAYAKTLDIVTHVGIVVIAVGYLVYILGVLPDSVSIDAIAANWHLRASEMQHQLPVPSGWSFTTSIDSMLKGDVISYMTIIYISLSMIACLLVAAYVFMREKNFAYTLISILQVAILCIAASGILMAGK